MTIKIHPRVRPVQEARLQIDAAVSKAIEEYELTYAELWAIFLDLQSGWVKYAIREERHPEDPSKPGAVE